MAALAGWQHGVVAHWQLLGLGLGESGIERRLWEGRLHRVHRNVYAVGHPRIGQRGWWWAAVLAYGPGALLSHRSAAALWGLWRPRGPIDVTAPTGRQGVSRRKGIWIHRCKIDPEERTTRGDIPVTTVARTLFDLAEVADFRRLEQAWEEADRLRLLRPRGGCSLAGCQARRRAGQLGIPPPPRRLRARSCPRPQAPPRRLPNGSRHAPPPE